MRAVAAFLLWSAAAPTPLAWGAFELRDASPDALGTASTDGAWHPFDDASGPVLSADPGDSASAGITGISWRAGATRASPFGADALSLNQLDFSLQRNTHALRLEYAALSGPGTGESSVRLEVRERAARPIALALRVERLDFLPDDAEAWGGWALGGCARAVAGGRLDVWIGGDRILRTRALERGAVRTALELGASWSAGSARAAILDRWEPDGTHGPRMTLEFPLGEAMRVRLGRGSAPGRIGVSLATGTSCELWERSLPRSGG